MFVTNNLSRWKQTKLRGIGAEEVKLYSSNGSSSSTLLCRQVHRSILCADDDE